MSRCRTLSVLAGTLLGLVASLFVASPAEAVTGTSILGHRCRTYDPAVTNEDTVTALIDTSAVAGATCEVDAWTLRDGTVIVWHDSTWGRVSDHATLPAGVRPTDRVAQATWAQVSQIRTKGGSPVARLSDMMDASALYDVPLVFEVRNDLSNPSTWVNYANAVGADVSYYRQAAGTCGTAVLQRIHAAGGRIGIKSGGGCVFTPNEMSALGVSFVSTIVSVATRNYVSGMRNVGIDVYTGGATRFNFRTALANGVSKLLVDHPRDAALW